MYGAFGPDTAMIVRPHNGGNYVVMSIEALFNCWSRYYVWSPLGWTRITGMIKQPQQSVGLPPIVAGSVGEVPSFPPPIIEVPRFQFSWNDLTNGVQSTCRIQNVTISCRKTDQNWIWEFIRADTGFGEIFDQSTRRHNIEFGDLKSAKIHAEHQARPHLTLPVQWMQSNENIVVGHASLIKVMSDPDRLPILRETLFSYLIEPLIRLVWDYVSYSWLVNAEPSEWYRCPLPVASETSNIPNEEPLLLVCDACCEYHGFKPHKVLIETEFYYHDPVTGKRFCEYHRLEDLMGIESNRIQRQTHHVTKTDLINHPNPRRYIDEWEKQQPQWDQDKWLGSCWARHDVQTDVLILAHTGLSHSISDGPTTTPKYSYHNPTKSNHKSTTEHEKVSACADDVLHQRSTDCEIKNGNVYINGEQDILKRFDCANGYSSPEKIFYPEYCYGIQTENKTFCAGIGFWAFTN